MTDQPIEQSGDADLRSLDAALQRAAQRARERARSTGTRLVLSENGTLYSSHRKALFQVQRK